MTTRHDSEHRDAARGYLTSVREAHHTLTKLYAKPNKSNDDWATISELKTMIHAGYDAAQVHATLALRDAVIELIDFRKAGTREDTLV